MCVCMYVCVCVCVCVCEKRTETVDFFNSQLATMGGLPLVGSLKLQVSFAEYRLFHRALLQKRLVILRRLLVVATPYMYYMHVQ